MKRIFLTGASAGIGLATAKLLIARGDEVWGTSRDPARIPQMPNLHPVRLDLNDSASLGESFHDALHQASHFDVVINNAGSGHFGPGELLSAEAVYNQFQTVFESQSCKRETMYAPIKPSKKPTKISVG